MLLQLQQGTYDAVKKHVRDELKASLRPAANDKTFAKAMAKVSFHPMKSSKACYSIRTVALRSVCPLHSQALVKDAAKDGQPPPKAADILGPLVAQGNNERWEVRGWSRQGLTGVGNEVCVNQSLDGTLSHTLH